MTLTVSDSQFDRAVRLATAMSTDPHATEPGDGGWTAEEVLNVALVRGLEVLDREYLS
jgi:hypothetical protein